MHWCAILSRICFYSKEIKTRVRAALLTTKWCNYTITSLLNLFKDVLLPNSFNHWDFPLKFNFYEPCNLRIFTNFPIWKEKREISSRRNILMSTNRHGGPNFEWFVPENKRILWKLKSCCLEKKYNKMFCGAVIALSIFIQKFDFRFQKSCCYLMFMISNWRCTVKLPNFKLILNLNWNTSKFWKIGSYFPVFFMQKLFQIKIKLFVSGSKFNVPS